jgi:hypothetical protein
MLRRIDPAAATHSLAPQCSPRSRRPFAAGLRELFVERHSTVVAGLPQKPAPLASSCGESCVYLRLCFDHTLARRLLTFRFARIVGLAVYFLNRTLLSTRLPYYLPLGSISSISQHRSYCWPSPQLKSSCIARTRHTTRLAEPAPGAMGVACD